MTRTSSIMIPLFLPLFGLTAAGALHAAAVAATADSAKVMRLDAGTAFPVPETGALIVGGGKELKVVFSPGEQERRSPYKSVDLREGDIVLMANGKRVRSVADLTRAYDSTLVGSEFKLGIQRGQEMMIVAYPKADPASFPKRQVRMITADQEGVAVFPAVGVLLEEKSGRVVVQDLLPSGSSAGEKLDVRAGDVITSINGKRVTTVKAYSEAYDALAVGSRVTWDTERAGKRLTVSFAKPTPVGPTVIRKTVE